LSGADDPEHIAELFAAFGHVSVRRMFGGAGLFCDGVMFGLVDEGVIYLKADATTIPAYEREGLKPFSYETRSGTHTLNSYWRMPERLYDDPEELADWARRAVQSAHRKTSRKPTTTPAGSRPERTRKRR